MAGDEAERPSAEQLREQRIPPMPFIDDIEAYMAKEGRSAESALQKLHERYNGYKLSEQRLMARKVKLKVKIPDIEKTLGVVKRMKQAQEEGEASLGTHFDLADAVYAKAKVPLTEGQTVFLWLGANVMLEYTVEEAVELLTKNLATAQEALSSVLEDLGYIKDQMTTSEVNIARVYNWDVRERRKKDQAGGSSEA
mmetsp:Transcript_15637/g.40509  ORF Transcript_15637/g.40509 Transcript_15637/m.40509 type:complete len:196 (-) Transcript_15637:270-857(-)